MTLVYHSLTFSRVLPSDFVAGDRVTHMNLEGVWDVAGVGNSYAVIHGPLRNPEETQRDYTVSTDALTIWITKEMLDALRAGEESLRPQEGTSVGAVGGITKAPKVTSGGCIGKPLEVIRAGTGRPDATPPLLAPLRKPVRLVKSDTCPLLKECSWRLYVSSSNTGCATRTPWTPQSPWRLPVCWRRLKKCLNDRRKLS
ncbi:hypothetical protein MQM1_025 [Aeromonas phage vB_AsaP_MQM1]|nr:hypothetical protein MQM1_025 [Aeromonas phage vB_AsaP_MQM1]